MSSLVFPNSDGVLKVHRQYNDNYSTNNNFIQNVKVELDLQVKQEILCSNINFDTYATVKTEEGSVYNAVWKENYFAKLTDLNKPRGLKYKCAECNETFVTKLSILTHSQFHRKSFCIKCLLYFENQQDRNKHLTTFHTDLIKLTTAQTGITTNNVDTKPTAVTLQSNISNDIKPTTKPTTGRKYGLKNRFPPLRKKIKIENEDPPPETTTKTIKSRFGRCITLKRPNY